MLSLFINRSHGTDCPLETHIIVFMDPGPHYDYYLIKSAFGLTRFAIVQKYFIYGICKCLLSVAMRLFLHLIFLKSLAADEEKDSHPARTPFQSQ